MVDVPEKELRRMDRFVQFAVVAADRAIKQCGLDTKAGDQTRRGVLVGSAASGACTRSRSSTARCSNAAPGGSARS